MRIYGQFVSMIEFKFSMNKFLQSWWKKKDYLDGTLLCLWVCGCRLRILATPINWYQLSFFTLSLSNHNNPLLLHYIIITKTSKGSIKMPQICLGWFLILNPVWCVSSLKEWSKRTCLCEKFEEYFNFKRKDTKIVDIHEEESKDPPWVQSVPKDWATPGRWSYFRY